ncbi:MAG TPA: ATP-binding protein [Kofleriaceae bacterium]|nr:ATP-binding protein [Kofleriaceae bacterium]
MSSSQQEPLDQRELFERMRDPIVIHRAGRIVHVNAACCALIGYSVDELVGRFAVELVHPDDRAFVTERIRALASGEPSQPTREHRLVHKDGSTIHVTVYSVPGMYEDQVASFSFISDQTVRKTLEAQLLSADRLASLGRLVAGVGHEINNPLTYMLGMLEVAQRELDGLRGDNLEQAKRRLAAALHHVREGSERVRDVVSEMKMFGRDEQELRRPVDVHAVLESSLRMASHEIRHRARLTRRFGKIPHAYASEGRLGQVFLNLIVNAAQSIEDGCPDANEIVIETYRDAEGRIVIEVSDTGAGVPLQVADRIFEPFVTTKGDGSGTGLGLSICHHIVTSLSGSIALVPRPGRGTCVRVILPAAQGAIVAATPPSKGHSTRLPRARLLVVDDEPSVGIVLAQLLGDHDVHVECSGTAALERLRGQTFDAILCDLHMADISGMDLFERVRTVHPGLEQRMIFMTAGAVTDRAREFLGRGQRPCLEKPFELEALEALVADVMA